MINGLQDYRTRFILINLDHKKEILAISLYHVYLTSSNHYQAGVTDSFHRFLRTHKHKGQNFVKSNFWVVHNAYQSNCLKNVKTKLYGIHNYDLLQKQLTDSGAAVSCLISKMTIKSFSFEYFQV